MKFRLSTDYSLRVLLYLAQQPEQRCSLPEIASFHRISEHHLVKIAHRLSQLGFITTVRGRGGGMQLRQPAEALRVGEIVRCLEDCGALIDCGSCRIAGDCGLAPALGRAMANFLGTLDTYSLADLVREQPMRVDRTQPANRHAPKNADMTHGPLFEGLPADARAALEAAASSRSFSSGQHLFHEGDRPKQLIVITEGQVKVWRSSLAGATMTIHTMGAGEVPGCMAAFNQIPYPASATAITDGKLLAWPVGRMAQLLRDFPDIAGNAMAIVGSRNGEMLNRLQEVAAESVEQRVARALLRLIERAPGEAPIGLHVSRLELAEMAVTTLHTVSRTISRWARSGIVKGGRNRIVVLDPRRLAALATGRS